MNSDMTYDHRYAYARMLYTERGCSISEIAAEIEGDEAEVRLWIERGSWEVARKSRFTFKETQIRNLYDMIDNLRQADGEAKTTRSPEQILKLTSAIKNLETDTSVGPIIEVAELFINWLRRRNLPLAKQITPEFDAFIKQRIAA